MNLAAWFKLMVFATVTALLYTHMQMQIVELAYKGKERERRVHELMDNNGAIKHAILTLRSANHLGQEILAKDDGLQFMGHDRVMVLSTPKAKQLMQPAQKPKIKAESPMMNWLSFLSIPEAKAWER